MRELVRAFIAEQELAEDRAPMWVGVSGGVDSMVLLDVLLELGHPCHVAHVDHGLRGSESDDDLAFVRDRCNEHGIPFRSERVDVQGLSSGTGISVQMAARQLRREWFMQLVREGPGIIALAHHQDDAVETMLVNLLRGSGSRGRAGISPRNGPVIRPLLAVGREDIVRYAEKYGVPYREDASNTDPKYLRNRVRHELIPFMEALRPGASRVLRRDVQFHRELVLAAAGNMERILEGIGTSEDGSRRIPFELILGSGTPTMVLHHLLRGKGFHPEHIADVLAALRNRATGSQFQEGELRVFVDREELVITVPPGVGSWTWNELDRIPQDAPLRMSVHDPKEFRPDASNLTVWLDADPFRGPLTLRPWQAGDRIRPLGMEGTKLVSDILIDAKVPRDRKETTFVLVSADDIVWVIGHVIDDRYRIQHGTRKVFRCEWTGP